MTSAQMKRWTGKRYLVLIQVQGICQVAPFAIDLSIYGNMDEWLPIEAIERVCLASLPKGDR